MPKFRISLPALALAVLVLAAQAAPGRSAELTGLESAMGLLPSDGQAAGLSLVPAPDISLPHYIGDWAPSQALELIRPEMAALTVKRLFTTCSCVRAILEKKEFAKGERVILTIRNAKPSPAGGANFGVFAEVETPERRIVEGSVFVKSNPMPNH